MNNPTIDLLENAIKRSNSSLKELNYRKEEFTENLKNTLYLISKRENEIADYLNAIKCLKQ